MAYFRRMERPVARTGYVVLTAVLTELVLIAAFANQWVSDAIVRNVRGDVAGHQLLAESWLTYTWRVSPHGHARDAWGSQLVLIAVTVVVTGLLVFAIGRGAVTFGRAFLGTWAAVIAATLVGALARGLVDPGDRMPHALRLTSAVFGDNGPDQFAAVGGFGLGFVTALLTGLIAVATRRLPAGARRPEEPADLPPYIPPEQPLPFFGPPTTQTVQLPRRAEPPPRVAEEPTSQFPRPPDDEHLY